MNIFGDSLFKPIDPKQVPFEYLRARVRYLLEADDQGGLPEVAVDPGKFICFVCRRIDNLLLSPQEELENFITRFGILPESPIRICQDCDDIIGPHIGFLFYQNHPGKLPAGNLERDSTGR